MNDQIHELPKKNLKIQWQTMPLSDPAWINFKKTKFYLTLYLWKFCLVKSHKMDAQNQQRNQFLFAFDVCPSCRLFI